MDFFKENVTKELWVIFIGFLIFLIPTFFIIYIAQSSTNGTYIYPLDDTYIHMAIAKNLSSNGIWGINSSEFASASSSILYTLLLALVFKFITLNTLVPLLINFVVVFLIFFYLNRWLIRQSIDAKGRILLFLVVMFFTPLPTLALSGMEHTLQCLFSFLFITRFSEWIQNYESGTSKKWNIPIDILAYSALLSSVRYEGLFLVAPACLILVIKNRFFLALKLGFIAALPMILFGFYSLYNAGFFLPNSLLMKSDNFEFTLNGVVKYISNILVQKLTVVNTDNVMPGVSRPGISLLSVQRLLIFIPIFYFSFRKYLDSNLSYLYSLILLLVATIIHLSFASTGWFYRYEAYLVFCFAIISCTILYTQAIEFIKNFKVFEYLLFLLILFFLVFPFFLRGGAAFSKASRASINIYEQQYQMGHFVGKFYYNSSVAANDIGAISFLGNGCYVVDMWGLGNNKVAASRKGNYWGPDFLENTCKMHNAKVAIVYDSWFNDSLLKKWSKVASWQISNNVICGDNTVSFYSINPGNRDELINNLKKYENQLPTTIKVQYY